MDKVEKMTKPLLLEVERRFALRPGFVDHILKRGATFVGKQSFLDTYYDTPSLDLTLNDYWLRKRGEKWMLKKPPLTISSSDSSTTTTTTKSQLSSVYLELKGASEIAKDISDEKSSPIVCSAIAMDSLGSIDIEDEMDMEQWLKQRRIHRLCGFNTDRVKYVMESEDDGISEDQCRFKIDVDYTNFGYSLFEIELDWTMLNNDSLSMSNEERSALIQQANQKLDDFCAELFCDFKEKGSLEDQSELMLTSSEIAYPKIQVYLWYNARSTHNKLESAGRLPKFDGEGFVKQWPLLHRDKHDSDSDSD